MKHTIKILLRINVMQDRNTIIPEIAKQQCGFVEEKGTTNVIYIFRTVIERAMEVQIITPVVH